MFTEQVWTKCGQYKAQRVYKTTIIQPFQMISLNWSRAKVDKILLKRVGRLKEKIEMKKNNKKTQTKPQDWLKISLLLKRFENFQF